MIVKYVNHLGEELNLNYRSCRLLVSDLLDYEWEAVYNGDKIDGFVAAAKTKNVNLDLMGTKERSSRYLASLISDIFNRDVVDGIPGQLFINDYYLKCYVKKSEKERWQAPVLTSLTLTILTDKPLWVKEITIEIPVDSAPVSTGLMYDYTYNYIYGENGLSVTFENEHFAACNFKLTAYGPFNNLEFAINGNLYRVNQSCAEGEMLVLDTSARTIVKVDTYGNAWNVFGKQDFTLDNFKQIPAGENVLSYGRTYEIDLTIYEERSEPKWSTW